MIEIANLHKKFGKLDALSDVSLTLGRGVITALVGPNGSGKTTLIKCLLGLVSPSQGELVVDGHHVNGSGRHRQSIGYMPQLAHFPQNLTASEVLRLVKSLREKAASEELTLIADFELGSDLGKKVSTLSGGTKQKLNAVIALMFNPGILILDEPTAGLDPVASMILKRKVRALGEQGTTIILSSHIMSEIEELADEIVFLHEGQVLFHGKKSALRSAADSNNLEEAVASLMKRGAYE